MSCFVKWHVTTCRFDPLRLMNWFSDKHNDDSSVSQCITLQATQTPIPSFVSNEVETSSTTQKSTQDVQLDATSTQVSGNTAPIQQPPSYETDKLAHCFYGKCLSYFWPIVAV